MPKLTSTYHSKLYRGFKEIEPTEYHSIVRYYEAYEEKIKQLEFSEFFELLIIYTEALFEIGAYRNHSMMVETAIEISVLNNIKFYNKKDIFYELLFKKAASYYNLMKYDEAEHILRELIKMDPYNQISVRFLKKCLLRKKPKFVKGAQAVSVVFFLVAAMIISVELIIIRPLYEMHTSSFEFYRNTIFILGVIVLSGSELINRFNIRKHVNSFVVHSKKRKVRK